MISLAHELFMSGNNEEGNLPQLLLAWSENHDCGKGRKISKNIKK